MHVRRGDLVQVRSGNDRGKTGKVLSVRPEELRVVVEGIGMRWKHLRKGAKNPQGGRVQRETPIAISNVLPYCAKCKRGVRARHERREEGVRRLCAKCGSPLGA
jgi:large subunit ribosomal protein L24